MTSVYNNPLFKQQIDPQSTETHYLQQFTIPSGTSLSIKGSVKMKYSFTVGLIFEYADNSTPENTLTATFKRDAYTFKEERENDGEEIS